ncbi:TetR/AcrR family transcriptional regulator [Demequina aurantiaca]|uniref:TetR/AcrR family transcriptional regulator n=1 Tax=Demequina aurantiaca TaxID=676200 RepID=UPI00078385E7|nr:TetR/AcrR family transcriptional regulator [Demequina aurantiaca]
MSETTEIRRRRSPKGEQRREAIIDAAAELFAQGGLDSASVADIATRAGLTQAGLLYHFPSKNALLLAVLDRRDQEPAAEFTPEGVAFVIGYLEILRGHEADRREMQFFAMLSTESIAPDHPAHQHFLTRHRNLVQAFGHALETVFDATKLPSIVQIADIADWLIAMSDGLRAQWLRDPDSVDRSESIIRLLESLSPYMFDDARAELDTYFQERRKEA